MTTFSAVRVQGLSAGVAWFGFPPAEAAAVSIAMPLFGHFAEQDESFRSLGGRAGGAVPGRQWPAKSTAVGVEERPTSFEAYVPDLPGCVTVAETRNEVLTLIEDAIEFHI
ncbi:MAG: type II toxin-antitoxin system HicB family antitoxin [Gammaproteobacteria bacterium]